MKRNISFSFLFTPAIIFFPYCGKDGKVGLAGNNGSIIYSGKGQQSYFINFKYYQK